MSQSFCAGHLNVCSLRNKVADLSVLLSQPSPFHIFGITESRLNDTISDASITVPNFSVLRRDPQYPRQTGIAVYIHNSVAQYTHRRTDLESESVESLWVEVRTGKSASLLVGCIYRNPEATFEWYDDFVTMMDKASISASEILLLGDFNINLFVSQPSWESTFTMLGLEQLITSATRVTKSSSTLIDHIYTSNTSRVLSSCVLQVSLSDHYAVCCSWTLKIDKHSKNQHTSIHYRSLKRFNQDLFLADLCATDFQSVYNHANPNDALAEWYRLFLYVLDRHAPLREKRVQQTQLPRWLTNEIRDAMALRDELKRSKDFVAFRKQRNRVRYLVREAKKKMFFKTDR